MKKILSILLSLISVICIAFAFSACGEEQSNGEFGEGKFYTVTEAYENGYLTREQVMSIAYYHNGGNYKNEEIMGEDYKPLSITPKTLSVQAENSIKQTHLNEYYEGKDYAELSGIRIDSYYGTYNGCFVVMISDDYSGTAGIVWIEEVAGINIYYISGNRIEIWRNIV